MDHNRNYQNHTVKELIFRKADRSENLRRKGEPVVNLHSILPLPSPAIIFSIKIDTGT